MSWLSSILLPVRFFLSDIEQTRDDRVSFRYGFTTAQVPDADGVNVLTFDTELGSATVTPTADKVVKRNGSGAIYGTTIVATAYSYATPVTITRDEPIAVDYEAMDPVTGWSINNSFEPESNDVGIEWRTELKLPVGSVLQSVAVRYTPPNGHALLPDQPVVQLATVDENGTVVPYESAAQDNAANVAAYELNPRTLTKAFAVPPTVASNKRYIVLFTSEDGANALPGLKLHRPARWTTSITGL